MLGAITGDIVGSRFEFDDHKSKEFELFGGDGIIDFYCEYTDDSVLTVAVADALLEKDPSADANAFKKAIAAAIFLARDGRSKEEIRGYIEAKYYPDAFAKNA